MFSNFYSDSIQSEPTRSSSASENLPFSISRLLSKPFDNNNRISHAAAAAAAAAASDKADQMLADAAAVAEHKFAAQLAHAGIPFSTASALYSYHQHHQHHPLYASPGVLRVPPQRTPLSWALPPMHPAALAHQAVKDRLAGEFI